MRKATYNRRPILCPLCCKGRIIDAAAGTDITCITLYGPLQAEQAQWFSKCPRCRQQIGLAFR